MFASLSTGVGKGTVEYFFGQQQENAKVKPPTSENPVSAKRKKNKKKKNKKADIIQEVEEDQDDDDIEELDILNMRDSSENESGNPGLAVLSNYESNHMSDPVTETIEEVIRKTSYSRLKVHACVMQMWDYGLKYDDADAVIEQLLTFQENNGEADDKGKAESTTGLISSSNNNKHRLEGITTYSTISNNILNNDNKQNYHTISPNNSDSSPAVPQKVIIAPAPSPASVSVPLPAPVQIEPKKEILDAVKSSSSSSTPSNTVEIWEIPPAVASAKRPRDLTNPPSVLFGATIDDTLINRVETCARYHNFSDAIAGLTTWAAVAKGDSTQAFYDSKALEIILETLFTETTQIIRPEIRTGLSKLLHKILPVYEGGSNAVASIISLLEILAIQINSTKSSKIFTETPKNLPTIVAYRIAASLRRLHYALKAFQSTNTVQATLSHLDAALADTTAALDRHTEEYRAESLRQPAQVDLKSAFIFRELQHERLELELQAAEALREASLRPRSQVSVPYLGGTNEDDIILESSLLAEAGESKDSIEAKKNQAFAARSYLERVLAEHTTRVAPLKDQLRDCVSQITDLYHQHQLLTSQIVKVENDIEARNTTRTFLQTSIEKEQGRYDAQVSNMDSTQSHVIGALQLDDNVNDIIHKVRELEGGLSAVVIGGAPIPAAPPAEEYPVRVAAASEALGAYIESETKCISMLAKRISLVETRAVHLRREIEEYKNLGMQSVGLEIETTMKKLKENAEEDQSTLSALLSALTSAVQRFSSCLTVDLAGVGMVTMPVLAITRAVASLKEAGVPVPSELMNFVIANPLPPPMTPPPGLTIANKHLDSHHASAPSDARVAQGKTAPSTVTVTTSVTVVTPINQSTTHSTHNKTSNKPLATSTSAHLPSASHSSFLSHQASQGQQRLSTGTTATTTTTAISSSSSSHQKASSIHPSTTNPVSASKSAAKAQSQSRQTQDKTAHTKAPPNQPVKSQGQSQVLKPQSKDTTATGTGAAQGRKKNPTGAGASAANPVARPPPVGTVKESKNPPVGSLKPIGGSGSRSTSTAQIPSTTPTTTTASGSDAVSSSENKKTSSWKGWSKDKNNANTSASAAVTSPVKSLLEIQKEEGEVKVTPSSTAESDPATVTGDTTDSNNDKVVVDNTVQESTIETVSVVAATSSAATPLGKEEDVVPAEVEAAVAEETVVQEQEVDDAEVVLESKGEAEVNAETEQKLSVVNEIENVIVEGGDDDEVAGETDVVTETETEVDEDLIPLERRTRKSRRE